MPLTYRSLKLAVALVGTSSLARCQLIPSSPPSRQPTPNGPLHMTSLILRNAMASAAEAELGALFNNAQQATILRTTLMELGHPQPPTPMQADNSTATGIANDTLKQCRSKAMDMQFYWIRDRIHQGHFLVYWRPGILNLGDYFTKHHPTKHHRDMRTVYLQSPAPSTLRGCVDPGHPNSQSLRTARHPRAIA